MTTWVPMFLFVILFGLSMDYEVFLLSRIRESYDATGDNAASVAHGLARTARVITAAAAIMIVVFLSFVAGAHVSVKQIGLGLAVAVLIDATLVRMVLVPAVMELLGKANWWLPGPLARVLPKTSLPEDEPLAGDLALTRAAGWLPAGGPGFPAPPAGPRQGGCARRRWRQAQRRRARRCPGARRHQRALPPDNALAAGRTATVGACANEGHFRFPAGPLAATACPASITS